MLNWMIAAPSSGGGKTVVTCALLRALQKRGLSPCALKCGPDYIDPMFHRAVLGIPGYNADLFLSDETRLRRHAAQCAAGHDALIAEGAMGFYDGLGGTTDFASAWHAASVLDFPVLLVLRPKGASLTLAAQVKGLQAFRAESKIAALFLTDCTDALASMLSPMLERETGLHVLGHLPHMEEASFQSRHLGLYTAGEIENLSRRIDAVAERLEASFDWSQFLSLGQRGGAAQCREKAGIPVKARIAVARDAAFCFLYEESLDALRSAGAELVFFSPLKDCALPAASDALYLPGGYPELYARALSENEAMRTAVKKAVEGGMPTVAECGGFLYLNDALQDGDGTLYPMAGVFGGTGVKKERLVRFGYALIHPPGDSMLFRAGEPVPAHEFHYWDCSENGDALKAVKPLTGRAWRFGYAGERLYAGFPHLYFAGNPSMARRFTDAAAAYRKERL